VFLNIPSCRGRKEESTSEKPEKNQRHACPHAPTTALPTRTEAPHALHASSSPKYLQLNRVDLTRHHTVISHNGNFAQSSATPTV